MTKNIKQHIVTVSSQTDFYKTYDIYEGFDNLIHCSCPSSIYQERECKHVTNFYYTPEYIDWTKGKTHTKSASETVKTPLKFNFDSEGCIEITYNDSRTMQTYVDDMTPEQCSALITEIENVLEYMRFYAKGK